MKGRLGRASIPDLPWSEKKCSIVEAIISGSVCSRTYEELNITETHTYTYMYDMQFINDANKIWIAM